MRTPRLIGNSHGSIRNNRVQFAASGNTQPVQYVPVQLTRCCGSRVLGTGGVFERCNGLERVRAGDVEITRDLM